MIDPNQARRTSIEVFFSGVDITADIKKYLLSLSYTDNEEDEADDLQIKLQDRDCIWLESWLNSTIQAAAESAPEEVEKKYKVNAQTGVAILSSKEDNSKSLGTLAYGTVVEAKSVEEGWVQIEYSDKTGYIKEAYLQPVYTDSGISDFTNNSQSYSTPSSGWAIGDSVIATGQPQYSSYGTGTPGSAVTNYQGSITYLNLKEGIPYPIHVGSLGWFAESQVIKAGGSSGSAASSNTGPVEGEASKGLRIQASIIRQNWKGNGEEEKMDCGLFELDSVAAQGPPSTITIKATSLPYSNTIRQTKKSKSWEGYSLKGICTEIATENGMTCMFLSNEDVSYQRVEQYMISDIGFLKKLCQDAGCSLKSTNNILVVFDQAAYENQEPIKIIQHGVEGGYSSYKLNSGENEVYTSCRVSYVDSSGTLITATAYVDDYKEEDKNNQCLEVQQKVTSIDEAFALATKMLRLNNKYEFTATFTFPGDPSLLAGCVVELSGWGAWSGRYIIKQAKHTVSNSGYSTQVTLRRTMNY